MAQSNIHKFFAAAKRESHPTTKAEDTLIPPANSGSIPTPEFDLVAGKFWLYPRSNDFRVYQFNITQTALCFNTLVAIPTGLGKTFIASAVILNYLCWFPTGKIVFLAPTRPLVAQQVNGVRQNANLSKQDVALATGEQSISQRQAIYQKAKVWFMTPQAMENDINRGLIDLEKIVLLVIDEAHRATGGYAYCNIINLLETKQVGYRLLALSATPAAQIQNIQAVIDSLKVAKIEVRSEADADIVQYTHQKNIDVVHVNSAVGFKLVEEQIVQLLGKLAQPVCFCEVLDRSLPQNPKKINKFNVLDALNRLGSQRGMFLSRIGPENLSECYNNLGMMMTFLHGKIQLSQHGLGAFVSFMTGFEDMQKDQSAKKNQKRKVMAMEEFKRLKVMTQQLSQDGQEHPKMYKLAELLTAFLASSPNSTAIVFTQFRNSAYAIKEFLDLETQGRTKSAVFIGQNKGTESVPGMAQKEQHQVIESFRGGQIQVLIATSVGEEGLDIGQVDLIVCFDSCSSPIRMIQRMGRTGRQRNGKVVVLVADGNEEKKYTASMKQSESLVRYMKKEQGQLRFYSYNPRMIPDSIVSLEMKECCFPKTKECSSEEESSGLSGEENDQKAPSKRSYSEVFPVPESDAKRFKPLEH